ncbi:MAG TPA: peptidylprolyl isomerase [Solirubrobacteraceae bacterium]|nr:peptidylprolyl isomerase [Solirubrobacteraceae bacterium]
MLRLVVMCLCCAVLVAACGDDSGGEQPASAPTAAPTAEGPVGCEKVEEPAPKGAGDLAKPDETLKPGTTYVATVSTNCGDFEITLDPKRAPKTGGSFKYLADKRFFDGTTFHRVVAGFVIQGGDPQGTGEGGPGYTVVEAPPKDLTYAKGVVAMAKTAAEPAGASGSQFFVVTAEDAALPADYALLGRVTAGQDVVDKIGVADTDPATEKPIDPVVINSITVTTK